MTDSIIGATLLFDSLLKIFRALNFCRVTPATKNFQHRIFPKLRQLNLYGIPIANNCFIYFVVHGLFYKISQ